MNAINDLGEMSIEELGRLFPILIVEYDPDWPNLFAIEKSKIMNTLGSEFISRIEHIGSTSVPGLRAKPTIDILLEVPDPLNCPMLIKNLKRIGYQAISRPENPPPHLMFAKGYSSHGITGQTFHIHVRYPGDWDELVFRDFLKVNPEKAFEYAELKLRLAAEFRHNREKYTDAKTDFIKQIVGIARLKNSTDKISDLNPS